MSNPRKQKPTPKTAWATASGRIKWLVDTRFDGNRSAMAKAIGFSHAIVGRVVAGAEPGRRLREAVVRHLNVDPGWMERGEGQPFAGDAGEARGTPVTNVLLPGPPLAHQPMLTGWVAVPEVVPSPTTYLLALMSWQPIVRQMSSGFRPGDQLLMETDPAKFPKEVDLHDELCVVRGGAGGGDLRLTTVRYYAASMDSGPARLEAEFPEPVGTDRDVIERVYRHHPDGEVGYSERRINRPESWWLEPNLPVIRYTDIVSVWLKILRRPVG